MVLFGKPLKDEFINRDASDEWRTIKFRGIVHGLKEIAPPPAGRWVYGYYVFHSGYDRIVNYEVGQMKERAIRRETLGEWTGLYDEAGVEIYEGDIVDNGYDNCVKNRVIEFRAGAFGVYDEEGEATLHSDAWVVLGNVHENPELLNA